MQEYVEALKNIREQTEKVWKYMCDVQADNYVSFALQNKQDIVLVYGCHIPDIDIDVDMTVRVIGRLRRHGNTVKVEANSIMRLS